MTFPPSMVTTAVLEGNTLGFGDPVAKEMSDFGDLSIISLKIVMGEGLLAVLLMVRNRA